MRIRALVLRIIRQFFGDKRSLALMFVAPLLVLTLLSLVFNSGTYVPKIGAIGVPQPLTQKLIEAGAEIKSLSLEEAEKGLTNRDLDAYLEMQSGKPQLKLEGSDPSVNRAVLMLFAKAVQNALPQQTAAVQASISYLHGSESMSMFDSFGPVLIGFFCFFFVFIIAGISFLRERTGGTLERLLASPLKRWELVAGYVLGFGLFTMLQAVLITWFSISILDIQMAGSFGFVLLVALLLSLTALTLGTFLSAFASNEFQMIQFIPIIVVPQVFFSGLFNLEAMATWLQYLAHIFPLYYGADALRSVMVRGAGWADIQMDVYILLAFSLLFMTLNVIALRKHRKI